MAGGQFDTREEQPDDDPRDDDLIEIVKPFALCLRLFANMTAGHFVILSLLGLIFLFANWFIAGGTVLFVLFMMCLELLVAFLQAYIFALLTSVFIGLMQHEH